MLKVSHYTRNGRKKPGIANDMTNLIGTMPLVRLSKGVSGVGAELGDGLEELREIQALLDGRAQWYRFKS